MQRTTKKSKLNSDKNNCLELENNHNEGEHAKRKIYEISKKERILSLQFPKNVGELRDMAS